MDEKQELKEPSMRQLVAWLTNEEADLIELACSKKNTADPKEIIKMAALCKSAKDSILSSKDLDFDNTPAINWLKHLNRIIENKTHSDEGIQLARDFLNYILTLMPLIKRLPKIAKIELRCNTRQKCNWEPL